MLKWSQRKWCLEITQDTGMKACKMSRSEDV